MWSDVAMTTPARRTKSFLVRMTPEEHAKLLDDASAEGVTVQVLVERRLLGKKDAQVRKYGPRPRPRQREELPLTG